MSELVFKQVDFRDIGGTGWVDEFFVKDVLNLKGIGSVGMAVGAGVVYCGRCGI